VSLRAAFETPDTKRRYVRRLFSTIADRYDLITAVLSYGQDARWKKQLVELARVRPGERALDLACGTGDIAFATAAQGARTAGLDITPRMLEIAAAKSGSVNFLAGDMTSLPFTTASFDLVTTGYGLRNVPDLNAAIDEIARVLRPGGRLLSLDFNRPRSAIVRGLYLSYLTAVGSVLGWVLHRDPDTYAYIPASIRRYPGAHGVASLLAARGFCDVRVVPLLFGLMSLHLAVRRR
jgi:demethylmenaquinone methyltransferase/2-methoxy-6-polyprenyl-1,4-benzoquinol methylase